jgi:PadR family transcriptional regulator PadR
MAQNYHKLAAFFHVFAAWKCFALATKIVPEYTSVTEVSMKPLAQLKKGTTVLAVLSALEHGEIYGYGIRREAFLRTKGVFTFNEGSLYPLLHALEENGLVRSRQEKVRGRQRKYYHITERGRRELTAARREWAHLLKALDTLLR